MLRSSIVLSVVSLLGLTAHAAQDTWTLTTADFRKSSVVLRSMVSGAIAVTADGADRSIPIDRVLRLDRDTKAGSTPTVARKYTLFLHNGDRMTGDPGDMKEEILDFRSPAAGALRFPLSKLRAISRLASVVGLDEEHKEDAVTLANHDVVRGVVAGIEGGKISIQSNNDTVSVPFASADTLLFASPARKAVAASRAFRVRLVDGSVFTSADVEIENGKLSLDLPAEGGKAVARQIDLLNVTAIEQLNGPVSWLSDRTPTTNKHVPFNSETTYPAKMDRNVFGKLLRVEQQTFEKGIGVHANSTVVFPLDPAQGYTFLRTRFAIDTTGGDASRARVNVRILVDEKVALERNGFKAADGVSDVNTVALAGAKSLTLEVTAADSTDTQDRLNWLETALVKEEPPVQAGPPTGPNATTRAASQPARR